jgi:hypothetical protein
MDLSLKHEPVGDLLPLEVRQGDRQAFALTDAQVAQFREQGFLCDVEVLTPDECDTLCHELDEFFDPHHPGSELWYEYHTNESTDASTALFHALGGWRLRPGFHDLLWNPRMVVPAEQLLEGKVRFWHDQLFCKPAKHGGVVAWHQDYSYWTRTGPMAHLTCWIPLDDVDEENGAIEYVPGSHNWPLLERTTLAGDLEGLKAQLTPEQQQALDNPVKITARRGHATFHHPLTVHGSRANRSARPRRAAVVNMIRDGVVSYSSQPLLDGVPVVPEGTPLGGQFFPLLSR